MTKLCDVGSAAVPELCSEVQQLCVPFRTALWVMPQGKKKSTAATTKIRPRKGNGEKRGDLFVMCDSGGRSRAYPTAVW